MASSSRRARKINRRSAILRAAEKLMQSRGLSRVTTRQISEEVGCSEGALYVHFKGRLELLLAMLEESLPDMPVVSPACIRDLARVKRAIRKVIHLAENRAF